MKKVFAIVLAITLLATMSGIAFASNPETGNGAPSGNHYTLNILGKDKLMPQGEDCNTGNRIFIDLGSKDVVKKTKIMLSEGPFQVLDCNGTDGTAAFQLPDPAPDEESMCTAYSVYVRALGKPGGKAKITTCAEVCTEIDPITEECVTWEYLCSTESVELERTKGKNSKPQFSNVSKELLTVCVEVCTEYDETTGECLTWELQRRYLFDDELQGFTWEYDSKGMRHAQLRFYPNPTCYSAEEWECPDRITQ